MGEGVGTLEFIVERTPGLPHGRRRRRGWMGALEKGNENKGISWECAILG
jgi:hypothetical protein